MYLKLVAHDYSVAKTGNFWHLRRQIMHPSESDGELEAVWCMTKHQKQNVFDQDKYVTTYYHKLGIREMLWHTNHILQT